MEAKTAHDQDEDRIGEEPPVAFGKDAHGRSNAHQVACKNFYMHFFTWIYRGCWACPVIDTRKEINIEHLPITRHGMISVVISCRNLPVSGLRNFARWLPCFAVAAVPQAPSVTRH